MCIHVMPNQGSVNTLLSLETLIGVSVSYKEVSVK